MPDKIAINLGFEDDLSAEVLIKILSSTKRFQIGTFHSGRGYGYLKKRIRGFNAAAKGMPYLVLTDLDKAECAPGLIAEWLPVPRHHNLIFRVAVREVEAWVLADNIGFARFLNIRRGLVPENVDEIPDPKVILINLAGRSCRRAAVEDIVPRHGSTAKQGPAYNERLSEFIRGSWNPAVARRNSPSLDRAMKALEIFQPQWSAENDDVSQQITDENA